MSRLSKLFDREISKPHNFNELKGNPIPYLQDCNRLEIFEFLYHLERRNEELKSAIAAKYPGKTHEEIMNESRVLRLKKRMIDIHKQSLEAV